VTNHIIFFPKKVSYEIPVWHHGAGLPSWIFIDELEVR